jgi:hypothetical protein
MLFDCPLANTHHYRDLLLRQILDTPQPENRLASVGKAIDSRSHPVHLLLDADTPFRCDLIYQYIYSVQIPNEIDRDNAISADTVHHKIAYNGKKQRLGSGGSKSVRALQNAHIGVVANVLYFRSVWPDSGQIPRQCGLVSQHLVHKPVIAITQHGGVADAVRFARGGHGLQTQEHQ